MSDHHTKLALKTIHDLTSLEEWSNEYNVTENHLVKDVHLPG